jgi:hypothetical protein
MVNYLSLKGTWRLIEGQTIARVYQFDNLCGGLLRKSGSAEEC